MAEKRDYYEVLGINRKANENEIKKAYRSWQRSIILIQTAVMQVQNRSLKRSRRLIRF